MCYFWGGGQWSTAPGSHLGFDGRPPAGNVGGPYCRALQATNASCRAPHHLLPYMRRPTAAGHPLHEQARTLLEANNPNEDKNSGKGLAGLQRRWEGMLVGLACGMGC